MKSHETIGPRLKRLRQRSGLTVANAAQAIGVSSSTYREWEYGRSIRGEPYVKIAEVFNVSLSELLLGECRSKDQALELIEAMEDSLRGLKRELMGMS